MHDQALIGKTIDGRYEVTDLLGQGGMATVYKAKEIGLERDIALKIMHAQYFSDEESRSRFEREGKILSSLKHRHIVTIYRLGLWNNQIPYLAMEYLEGLTLKQILNDRGTLPPNRCLEIAMQLCDALAYANEHGVIHRDVKPDNIMILQEQESWSVKLVDFGLMRLMPESWQQSRKLTQTGLLIGTAQYFSPEQCLGQIVDQRSDIYSLACVIYECLSGHPPLEADHPIGLIHKHAHEMPTAPSTIHKSLLLPEGLDNVLLKALQKDKTLRYQSMREFKKDLTCVQSGQSGGLEFSPQLSHWATNSKQHTQKKLPLLISLSVLIAALSVVVYVATIKSKSDDLLPKKFKSVVLSESQKLATAEKLSLDVEKHAKHNEMSKATAATLKTLEMLALLNTNTSAADQTRELTIMTRLNNAISSRPPNSFYFRFPTKFPEASLYNRYAQTKQLQTAALLHQIKLVEAQSQNFSEGILGEHEGLFRLYLSYDFEKAGMEIDRMEELVQTFPYVSNNRKASLLCRRAELLHTIHKIKNREKIKAYLHEAFRFFQQERYTEDGQYDKLMLLNEILSMSISIHDSSLITKVLSEMKTIYNESKENSRLFKEHLTSADFLSNAYMQLGRYKEAKKYGLEALQLQKIWTLRHQRDKYQKEELRRKQVSLQLIEFKLKQDNH